MDQLDTTVRQRSWMDMVRQQRSNGLTIRAWYRVNGISVGGKVFLQPLSGKQNFNFWCINAFTWRDRMIQELPEIPYGKRPKVLLLGNGINRAFNFGSWDDLLQSMQSVSLDDTDKKALENVPYPLRTVILTEDQVDTVLKEAAGKLSAMDPCEEEKTLLSKVADLPVDAILTTNYTYEIEKTFFDGFQCLLGRRCARRKKTVDTHRKQEDLALHTYMDILPGKPIWHIHGEAAKPNTMILGHYYYGKLLSYMHKYIPTLIRRYAGHQKANKSMSYQSWVDYFMLGDVYVVGLGLDLSEIDLWWLINCKKRHYPETKVYFYCPDITSERSLIAKAYNVQVISQERGNRSFEEYYRDVLESLCTS